jgi:branched-subunit amino acid aminotransferase/4-amino-4-deoxychorismate lyase
MSAENEAYTVAINGTGATVKQLEPLAFAGFAHFTAMQVRDGRVKGLDLHLQRLRSASLAFYGQAMSDALVRAHLRAAVESGPRNVSLSITMFAPSGEFTAPAVCEAPSALVRTGPPNDGPSGPLRLAVVEHERALPGIKHVGESGKTFFLREASRRGFDDAAFLDRSGSISEATIWNLAFWDGHTVIWPTAPALPGVTMGIMKRQLASQGLPQREESVTVERLQHFKGAVVMNSWSPGVAVGAIGPHTMADSSQFQALLHEVYQREQAVPL